jgi:sec-independent protein translocase protein TatA
LFEADARRTLYIRPGSAAQEVAMGALSPMHLILVLLIVLIIFGPGRLPEVGEALGRGIREFRRAADSLEDEVRGDKS